MLPPLYYRTDIILGYNYTNSNTIISNTRFEILHPYQLLRTSMHAAQSSIKYEHVVSNVDDGSFRY